MYYHKEIKRFEDKIVTKNPIWSFNHNKKKGENKVLSFLTWGIYLLRCVDKKPSKLYDKYETQDLIRLYICHGFELLSKKERCLIPKFKITKT